MKDLVVRDKRLLPVWEKVQQGARLELSDGLILYQTDDVISLGKMAHAAQRQKSEDAVYFVMNQKIEHTNICVLSCSFCDFAKKKGEPGAYEMTREEILALLSQEIREVHITGGMPPDWPWERYLDIVRSIRSVYPEMDIKAFTAVEIDFFHKKFKLTIEEVLRQLKAAGLRTMPGGGAEVFSERVRKILFNQKIGAKTYLDVHRTAHSLGIPTNCTMLYGHIETLQERLTHMIRLRELQDETGGFLTFIPLAFQPGETGIKPRNRFTSAIDDLKTIAVSRLMLDNFPHIKAYWIMLTEEVASVALTFGADDIDGTVGQERIAHDAGAVSPMKLAREQITRIIRDAGKIPVERDAYYNPITVGADHVVGKIPYLNSVPFYQHFDQQHFKLLPVVPRRMGLLQEKRQILAGLYSLADYLRMENGLELLPWCIATRDQVKSVMLFSKEGWGDLDGKLIGITDETATSVRLLQILLEKKYGVKATFERLHAGVNDCSAYDAVLLIGDEALRRNKHGLPGLELVFDLAREWYDWKKMPFVFAVWAISRSAPPEAARSLGEVIESSLRTFTGGPLRPLPDTRWLRLGMDAAEIEEYLEGFSYRLGERERESISEFRKLLLEVRVPAL
jgi:aminodeoxyfutalosine synthase